MSGKEIFLQPGVFSETLAGMSHSGKRDFLFLFSLWYSLSEGLEVFVVYQGAAKTLIFAGLFLWAF